MRISPSAKSAIQLAPACGDGRTFAVDFLAAVRHLDPLSRRTDLQLRWQLLGKKPIPSNRPLEPHRTAAASRPCRPITGCSWKIPSPSRVVAGHTMAAFPGTSSRSPPRRHIGVFSSRGKTRRGQVLSTYARKRPARGGGPVGFRVVTRGRPGNSNSQTRRPRSVTNGIGGSADLRGPRQGQIEIRLRARRESASESLPVDRHIFASAFGLGETPPLHHAARSAKPGRVRTRSPASGFRRQRRRRATVEIELRAEMLTGRNTTVFHFRRPTRHTANSWPAAPKCG